jgi:hypothetical protein
MLTIKIVLYCSIIAVAYQILIRPGELLQRWARFVNLGIKNTLLQKLLLCPYCFAGQMSLWSCLVLIFWGCNPETLISVPATIVVVYFVVHKWFK